MMKYHGEWLSERSGNNGGSVPTKTIIGQDQANDKHRNEKESNLLFHRTTKCERC